MYQAQSMRSVLDNFLSTLVSRNSDHDGYWLLGQIYCELTDLQADLLGRSSGSPAEPLGFAQKCVSDMFLDQMTKGRIRADRVRSALLNTSYVRAEVWRFVNGCCTPGSVVQFVAEATMSSGMKYTKSRDIFVAPHDPSRERQSMRAVQSAAAADRKKTLASVLSTEGWIRKWTCGLLGPKRAGAD